MLPVTATAQTVVGTAPLTAFLAIAPIPLPAMFRGYGPLPAVVATEGQTGAWDVPGQTRRVKLSDGSEAREQLTDYDPPTTGAPGYFAYRVSEFTGPLRLLTTGARGEWWFQEVDNGSAAVRWRYAFEPRSVLVRPLLWAVVRPLWAGYMRKALAAARLHAERGSAV